MTIKQPINPSYGSGSVTVIGAAGTGTIVLRDTRQVILTNQGANAVYVKIGAAGIAATTADYPVQPGVQVVITKGGQDNTLAYNSPAGTTLHVMCGEGW